jgi:manganese transport protein
LLAFAGPGYMVSVGYTDPGNWATDLAGGAQFGYTGATVMPHNLYLHSSIVQTRAYQRTDEGRRDAIKWATTDSTVALMLALFINAAILIVAAAAFHESGHADVAEIGKAFELLSPLLGLGIASTLFAIALLASGLNSTVTATLAGQIVMEGFLRLRIPNWARRLLTRGIAIIPVVVVTALYGEKVQPNFSCW